MHMRTRRKTCTKTNKGTCMKNCMKTRLPVSFAVRARFAMLAVFVAALLLALLTACSAITEETFGSTDAEHSGFTVYFIDVGQADSALIVCDGAAMLIDGGNVDDSNLIYSFLQSHGIKHLDYIVATHAHEDHVGGLSGALRYATAGAALCSVVEYNSDAFKNFVKSLEAQNLKITVPSPGDVMTLGSAEVVVLGPVRHSDEPNNISLVIKINYGETSFLFTGDAERAEEADLLDRYGSETEDGTAAEAAAGAPGNGAGVRTGMTETGIGLSANVLKVGHHGSDTSSSYPFLREIMPEYAVISCGTDNSYGHPHEETLSRLRDADVLVYRTDMQGTVVCISDGRELSFMVERNEDARTNPVDKIEETESYYIGNVKSLKFHRPSCGGLPDEKNSIRLNSRDEAIAADYEPCGRCKS